MEDTDPLFTLCDEKYFSTGSTEDLNAVFIKSENEIKFEPPFVENSEDFHNESDEFGDEIIENKSSERKSKRLKLRRERKLVCNSKSFYKKPVRKKKVLTEREEILPNVKEAVFNTFSCSENLDIMKYKNVELKNEGDKNGLRLTNEELNIYKSENEDGKMFYQCEDCSFSSEHKNVFAVHFIMHANMYFIMETINKTLSSHYCYVCDERCLNKALLRKHLAKHKQNDDKVEDNEATEDVPQSSVVLKVEFVEDRNYEDKMDDEVMQECHYFPDTHHSDEEINENVVEHNSDLLTQGLIKIEPCESLPDVEDDANVFVKKECYEDVKNEQKSSQPSELDDGDDAVITKHSSCDLATNMESSQRKCNELWQCDLCGKFLQCRRSYTTHRKHHFCGKCSFESPSVEAVVEHKKISHEYYHKCLKCDFKTAKIDLLKKHVKNKSCKQTNIKETAVKPEIVGIDGSPEIPRCDSCNLKANVEVLSQHKCKEVKKCDLCGELLRNKRTYNIHRKNHFCGKCSFESSSIDAVLEHKKTSPDCCYKCLGCEFRTVNMDSLKRHIKNTSCEQTGDKHERDAIDENIKNESKITFSQDKAPTSKCSKCKFVAELGRSSIHKCREVKKCEMCKKVLRNERCYRFHVMQHTCTKCTFKSPSIDAVIAHKKVNLECWHKCSHCTFKTINIDSYHRHRRSKSCKKPTIRKERSLLKAKKVLKKPEFKKKVVNIPKKMEYKREVFNVPNKLECKKEIMELIASQVKVEGSTFECQTCQYKAESWQQREHKCQEVKPCDLCTKVLRNQKIFRYHRRHHFCNECSFQSSSTDEVVDHRKANPDCWYKCSNCQFKTPIIDSYRKHIKNKSCPINGIVKTIPIDKLQEPLTCDTCGYKAQYKAIMEKHLKICKVSSKFYLVCDLCGKACSTRQMLTNHRKQHYCLLCPFMSVSREEVVQHKISSPNCRLKCDTCNFQTVHPKSIWTHKKRCGLGKNFCCDSCSFQTTLKVDLVDHVKKHMDPKPYQCSQCGFKCSQKGNLRTHEKKHISEKSYCCTVCNFQCFQLRAFHNHKKLHGVDEEQTMEESKVRDDRFFYCDKCEFRTKYSQYYKNHILKHENVCSILCPYCGKAFASSVDYHGHKNNCHKSQDKIFKCLYCDYSSKNKGTVKIHERKHTGAKPYSCEFCSYSTSYCGNLAAHRKKHLAGIAGNTIHHASISAMNSRHIQMVGLTERYFDESSN